MVVLVGIRLRLGPNSVQEGAHAQKVGRQRAKVSADRLGRVNADEHNWWSALEPFARRLSATILIGALTGAVVGGLGGRLAMRILFLTTGDTVKGIESDDGFTIGRFTLANTLSLVVVTTLGGIFAALLYLAARPFVAGFGERAIPMAAVFYGVVGGALIVKPEGVDFVLLEPAALAIALFVIIPAAFGAVVSWQVNRATQDDAWPDRSSWWLLGPPLLLVALPPMLFLTVVIVLTQAAGSSSRAPRLIRAGGLIVIAALFALGAVDLGSDAAELI
jgi:hypothetical protein